MARTVKEIKDEMTAEFVSDSAVVEKYGLDTTKTFDEQFSKVSIESIIFYVFAFCAWTVEKLFDTHKAEVTNYIDEMKPHSLRWYVNKVRQFRYGQALETDTDQYDNTGLTDEDIAEREIVKFASAEEIDGKLYIKVAKDDNGTRTTLDGNEEEALKAYIQEVKDAGVRIVLRNAVADKVKIQIIVYYNPMILNSDGERLSDGVSPVPEAIVKYMQNLPFNGEMRKVDFVDALQAVEGVVMPELLGMQIQQTALNSDYETLTDAYAVPYSGHYEFDGTNSTIIYEAYENVSY